MCQIIAINRGEIEITSPEEFNKYFGFLPIKEEGYNEMTLDCCLCQCDLNKTFKDKKIKYWFDKIDTYFVGELDKLDKS